jgi:hypothetical protein
MSEYMLSCHPVAQDRRSRYLLALAELDGRHSPDHPHHGTFTGLYQSRVRELIDRDMAELLDNNPQTRKGSV